MPGQNQPKNAADAIAGQPAKFAPQLQEHLAKLGPPNTGNLRLTAALKRHLPSLLEGDGIIVPNDPEEMRWRLFFAHSQDMNGFRADIFTGGPNEADNPYDPSYRGLRDRWPDGKSMIKGLAQLWLNPEARETLCQISNPFRSDEEKQTGVAPALALLRGPLGNVATRTFADAFEELKGPKIARRTNTIVRAYCQNAAVLAKHDYCFQSYLYSLAKPDLPSDDISAAEKAWVEGLQRDFYNVGPALAPYLVADWLLGFWCGGSISWFSLYKADSVFLKAVSVDVPEQKRYLPAQAGQSEEAFIAYCRTLRLPPEMIPPDLWLIAFYNLPPRIVNEVIWLDNNQSTPSSHVETVPELPDVPTTAMSTGASTGAPQVLPIMPNPSDTKPMSKLAPSAVAPAIRAVLHAATEPLTAYDILERLPQALRDQLIAERGLPGAGSGNSYSAATLVTQAVEKLLPSKEAPYRVYEKMTGKTFTIAGQVVTPGNDMIATYRIPEAPASQSNSPSNSGKPVPGAVFVLPAGEDDGTPAFQTVAPSDYSEDTLDPPGHTPNPDNPYILVVNTTPPVDKMEQAKDTYAFSPLTASAGDKHFWVGFTSRKALRDYLGDGPTNRQRMELSALIELWGQMRSIDIDSISGIVLDPRTPTQRVVSSEAMERALGHPVDDQQAQELYPGTTLPISPLDEPLSAQMTVVVPVHESEEETPNGHARAIPVAFTLSAGRHWLVYTNFKALGRGMKTFSFQARETTLGGLCGYYLNVASEQTVAGIVVDLFGNTERYLTLDEIKDLAAATAQPAAPKESGSTSTAKPDDVLSLDGPRTLLSTSALQAVTQALSATGTQEAWGLVFTFVNGKRDLALYFSPFTEETAILLKHLVKHTLEKQAGKEAGIKVVLAPIPQDRIGAVIQGRGEQLLPLSTAVPAPKMGLLGRLTRKKQ